MAIRRRRLGLMLCVVAWAACSASATILYSLEQIDAMTWQYTYEVRNDHQGGPMKALTIWFDRAMYSDLTITSGPAIQAHWGEELLLSVPGLGDGYDVFGEEGVAAGGKASGFSVRFTWLGEDLPGSQLFHILNPTTFETVLEGMTVPEPSSLGLMLVAALFMRKRGRWRPDLH